MENSAPQNPAIPTAGDPANRENKAAVERHVSLHVGRPKLVLGEEVSHAVNLEVLCVAPRSDQDFWTLVTSGMSDRAMPAPEGPQHFSRIELLICLPGYWKLTPEAFNSESMFWPVRLLKRLARAPHLTGNWASWGQITPHEIDHPCPYADGVPFYGSILGYPTHFGPEFEKLVRSGHEIHFLAVYPLFREEMDLALKKGPDAVFKRFAQKKISEIVDVDRPNTCAKSRQKAGLFADWR